MARSSGQFKRIRPLIWVVLVLALPGGAQNSPLGNTESIAGQLNHHGANPSIQFGESDPIEEQRRLRLLNAERQKEMVSDANKLLKLAAALDAEVETERADSLTPAQIRTLNQIEKLAREVKLKMAQPIGGGPVFQQPPLPPSGIR